MRCEMDGIWHVKGLQHLEDVSLGGDKESGAGYVEYAMCMHVRP